jgi:altronate dehydratase small subunit
MVVLTCLVNYLFQMHPGESFLMKYDAIMIKNRDNVATALRDLVQSQECRLSGGDGPLMVIMKEPIVFGHKFAVVDIQKGEDIIKYGEVIGKATVPIVKGTHAHIQNIESLRGRGDLAKKGE